MSYLVRTLIEKDPHCYYCGTQVKLYEDIRNREMKKNETYPSNMATIEHLYDRFDPRHYLTYPNNEDKVLCCYQCNHIRGIQRVSELNELHLKRSTLGVQRPKGSSRFIYYSEHNSFEQVTI